MLHAIHERYSEFLRTQAMHAITGLHWGHSRCGLHKQRGKALGEPSLLLCTVAHVIVIIYSGRTFGAPLTPRRCRRHDGRKV